MASSKMISAATSRPSLPLRLTPLTSTPVKSRLPMTISLTSMALSRYLMAEGEKAVVPTTSKNASVNSRPLIWGLHVN